MAVYSLESSQDSCYEGTTVLINKLNIRNQNIKIILSHQIPDVLTEKITLKNPPGYVTERNQADL